MTAYRRLTTSRPKTTHHTSRQRSFSEYDDYSRQPAPRPETSYNTHQQHQPQRKGSNSRHTSRPASSHHTNQLPPHSSRNVNTNHHTACMVSSDDPPLTLNVRQSRSRRSDVYDVPEALQNIMKLNDGVISKRLKKRLCSAGRVYCGNNILNLHKRMYERPRPGSSQYHWSSTDSTMILPTIVRGPARAKTAGSSRNRNREPEGGCPRPLTAVEKKRNDSREPDNRNTKDEVTKDTDNKGQEKEGNANANANANSNANANANAKANTSVSINLHANVNANDSDDNSSQSSDSSSESDSSRSSDSSSSDAEQGEEASKPLQQKKKEDKQRRGFTESKKGNKTETKENVPNRDRNQRDGGVRFSKQRGLNSDDDYSTDSSESSRGDKGK